ncbi:DUF6895 family protein [Streptomyces sp. NPDC002454]
MNAAGAGVPPAPARRADGATEPDVRTAAQQVLDGALRWLTARVEWFAPERWEEFLPPRPFRAGPLLELLGLVRVLERSGLLPHESPLRVRALDLGQDVVAGTDFANGLRRADQYFPYHLSLIGLLELLGRPQPALHATCQALLTADAGGHSRPYKPVLNRIELRYFVDRGRFTAPALLPDLATLHRQSIAALVPDVLQLTEDETYAFTHVLFYTTDFGLHRDPIPADGREVLRETTRTLLGLHLARGSLDLLSELLLCEAALGAGPGPLTPQAWRALARAQREDGAVPSPVHDPATLARLSGPTATAYLFGTCYHTTQVAALAAHHRVATGTAGPRLPAGPVAHPLPRAGTDEIRAWARRVTTTERPGGRARSEWSAHLVPLLAHAVREHDSAALTDLLRAAEHLGQGDRPVVRSAAALLRARRS